MKKIIKILNDDYKFHKRNQIYKKKYLDLLKEHNIKFSIKDEFDYFFAFLIAISLQRKQQLDRIYFYAFEEIKTIENNLSFEQKNNLLLEISKETITGYQRVEIASENIIFPVFPVRYNNLYSKDPASFSIPKYRDFITKFKEQIDPKIYYPEILNTDYFNGFYDKTYDAIYDNEFKILTIQKQKIHLENEKIDELIIAYTATDTLKFLEILLSTNLTSKKLKKLTKYYDQLLKKRGK